MQTALAATHTRQVKFAGRVFDVRSSHKSHLSEFSSALPADLLLQPLATLAPVRSAGVIGQDRTAAVGSRKGAGFIYRPLQPAPTRKATERWLRVMQRAKKRRQAAAAGDVAGTETAGMYIDSAGRQCFDFKAIEAENDDASITTNTSVGRSGASSCASPDKHARAVGTSGLERSTSDWESRLAGTAKPGSKNSDMIRELLEQRPPSPKYDESFCLAASYAPMSQAAEGGLGKGFGAWNSQDSHASDFVDSPVKSLMPSCARAPNTKREIALKDSCRLHNNVEDKAAVEVDQRAGACNGDGAANVFQTLRKTDIPAEEAAGKGAAAGRLGSETANRGESGYKLTMLSVEVQCESRRPNKGLPALNPDPRFDAVRAVCYVVQEDGRSQLAYKTRGCIVCVPPGTPRHALGLPPHVACVLVHSEQSLYVALEGLVRDTDPDILLGFEVQNNSFGYLLERAAVISFPFDRSLSRCPVFRSVLELRPDEYGQMAQSGIHICGREILNVWRICRGEIKLATYSYPHVCEKVLNKRVPVFSFGSLHTWFEGAPPAATADSVARSTPPEPEAGRSDTAAGRMAGAGDSGERTHGVEEADVLTGAAVGTSRHVEIGRRKHMRRVLMYHLDRADNSLSILSKMELIGRTCELARVFGIHFFAVLSRGSQYRVESMLYRLCRSQNYCLVSPSIQQRQAQPATECIPLVMEPLSAFYESPICVLDFRSLYPSVVIAYNLCYSTLLGKIGAKPDETGHVKLGVSSLMRPPGMLAAVQQDTYVAPNGAMFLKSHVREGVLPRLLREILSARVAVKKLMKVAETAGDMALYRALNARQFGLKLIANVTYGYTSAGFSGRMPCAELADAIVQAGRESLERAIRTVESKPKEWGARVVYGDTDSLFVELPGRSRHEAFRIGKEIAAFVTAQNPAPMELELEKVYHPSLMISKKRYVGYAYESAACDKPKMDPKGIEMVRRDGCKLLSRVQEECVHLLFETKDLSRVKRYLQSVMTSITTSSLNTSEFVFAKEVRAGSYRSATLPPAAVVDEARRRRDPRAGALYSERVPYVVVCGPPGSRLVDLVVDPLQLVNSRGALRINAAYYIDKQLLPALERLFSLLGADVRRWYLEMPRSSRDSNVLAALGETISAAAAPDGAGGRGVSIRQHFLSINCILCDSLSRAAICAECATRSGDTMYALLRKRGQLEAEQTRLLSLCAHCTGARELGEACEATDCWAFFSRSKVSQLWLRASDLETWASELLHV